jgi:hypothetical protein
MKNIVTAVSAVFLCISVSHASELNTMTLKDVSSATQSTVVPAPLLPAAQSGGEILNPENYPLSALGRGAKLTLSKDLEIPANADNLVLPSRREILKRADSIYGQSFEYVFTTYLCGIQMKEASPERRVIKAGDSIEFTGKSWTQENEPKSPWLQQIMETGSPSAVAHMGCIAYRMVCETMSQQRCGFYKQAPFTISDFKNTMREIGTVTQADPSILEIR